MSESNNPDSASSPNASRITSNSKTSCSWLFTSFMTVLVPVVAASILYNLDSFDPAPLPPDLLTRHAIAAPASNKRMLRGAELVGVGNLEGPEDVAYDRSSGVIYTGCADGWINRVNVNDSEVQKWINTGGRPLGIAVDGLKQEVVVADAKRGLLKVTAEGGKVEVLTDEAEGQKFRTTDAVDVAQNGIVYFSDASYKYSLDESVWDILEGKLHGRLLSYDPATKTTQVLLPNLYFANGVAVSPDQNHVIFCETTARRCRKYHISGNEKGKVDKFIENLPGMPDNIRYDGEGHYWIALAQEYTLSWYLTFKYPLIRKLAAIALKYIGRPYFFGRSGGVLVVDLAGKPIAHYYDPELPLLTSAMKIGDHLYCGFLVAPYIISLNLKQYPAV